MTRFQFLFAFGTICSQWYISVVFGKSLCNEEGEKKRGSNVTRYVPFKAQLQYASVAIQNNGMVQYVIKVVDAEDTECFFNFPNLEEETSVNDVMTDGDVVTGILLLDRGPSWMLFNCFSAKGPVLSQYLFTRDVPSNVSTQMELRDTNGCKISEPVFSSNEYSYIIDIEASCSFPLKQDNALLSLDGAVLNNGNISYYIHEDTFNATRTYKNGVAKVRFAVSNHIPQNTRYVPWFTLQLKDKGGEEPLRFYKHMYLSNKALDGTSPVIPKGTVAIAIHPSEEETIYVQRGSKTKVICEAYGNPKPLIEWNKSGQLVTGEKNLANFDWDPFYEYESLVIKDMDDSKDGKYSCKAQSQGATVTKSIIIKVCDPATVTFSTTQDESYVNATLSATQDDSNKVFSADCYKGRRATNDAWINDYDPYVTITRSEDDLSWEQTYSWTDKGDVPNEMYCEIRAKCVILPMIFHLNV